MKTYSAKKQDVIREWYLIDAEGKTLGRLATRVANLLRGKHKPVFTTHIDTGDYVVIINASKVRVTGRKYKDKMYHRHSGYVGGLKEVNFETLMAAKPTEAVREAIRGMLPKNHLGREMLRKLKVFAGEKHPYAKSNLKSIELQ